MAKIEDYSPIAGREVIDELRCLAERLKGKLVQYINSTAVGGGVAEILTRMVPLLNELGVDSRWDVIKGGEEFFDVTKKFHNALHGGEEKIEERDFREIWKNAPRHVKIKNPAFEKIEKKYIKAVVSELGILTFGEFVERVRKSL